MQTVHRIHTKRSNKHTFILLQTCPQCVFEPDFCVHSILLLFSKMNIYLKNRRCWIIGIVACKSHVSIVTGRCVVVPIVDHRIKSNRGLSRANQTVKQCKQQYCSLQWHFFSVNVTHSWHSSNMKSQLNLKPKSSSIVLTTRSLARV